MTNETEIQRITRELLEKLEDIDNEYLIKKAQWIANRED